MVIQGPALDEKQRLEKHRCRHGPHAAPGNPLCCPDRHACMGITRRLRPDRNVVSRVANEEPGADGRSASGAPEQTAPGPVNLAGTTELRVVGVTFRTGAVALAWHGLGSDRTTAAFLVPDPGNKHDPWAVRVIIRGEHVGWLSRHISPVVQPALNAFSTAHQSRAVSCPARFAEGSLGMRITLHLDLTPLGLSPSDIDDLPELDQVILNLISRLDTPAAPLTGCDERARRGLAEAEADRAKVDGDRGRSPRDWPRVEQAFRSAARLLEAAGDPLVSDAWLGVAMSTRWQRGRGEDMLSAAVEALHWNIGNVGAWHELIGRAAAAPHVRTLVSLFARVPPEVRRPVLSQLLAISRGHDRMGRMSDTVGGQLRGELLELARAQGDDITVRRLNNAR